MSFSRGSAVRAAIGVLLAALAAGVTPGDVAAADPSASHCPDGPPCGWPHGTGTNDPTDPKVPTVPEVPVPPTPTGGTVGQVSLGQANIPPRSGGRRFRRGIRQLTAGRPDFLTLEEQFNHSVEDITRVATGYAGFRDTRIPPGRDGAEALSTVVLWRAGRWSLVRGGRIRLVNDDRSRFRGHVVTWDRFATWATLRSRTTGEVVSVVAVHHMTNPAKYGPRKKHRQKAYRKGMNRLVRLSEELGRHRHPVLLAGDFNAPPGQWAPWAPTAKLGAAGFQWVADGVDYVFYPASRGLRVTQSCTLRHKARVSDHRFLVGRIALNAAGLRQRARSVC